MTTGPVHELQGTAEREAVPAGPQKDELVALGTRGIEALIAIQKEVIAGVASATDSAVYATTHSRRHLKKRTAFGENDATDS
jgi:hypothetical protein